MKIKNKAEFFRLWRAGELGNRTNIWDDPQEAYLSKAPEIGFRQIGQAGGGAWEKVPREKVFETAQKWRDAGRTFIMDDGCPDWCRTLQGEVCRTYRGIEGFLDTVGQLPIRPAIAAGHMVARVGVEVLMLLDHYMDPSSRDDLDMLMDRYPDATVEFSCFGVNVGVFPNRNTIFWEVRDY